MRKCECKIPEIPGIRCTREMLSDLNGTEYCSYKLLGVTL